MFYPLNLNNVEIFPLFGSLLEGKPHVFDFSSNNPKTLEYNPSNFQEFDATIFEELRASGSSWGIGKYLEERKNMLREYPNIIEEQRFYHLGLDIVVPYDTPLFVPLAGEVVKTGKETAIGNYGGFVMLKHTVNEVVFYSFYGHLKTPHTVQVGDTVQTGQEFARIGKESDSGGWFCHVHLQILTQAALDAGYTDWGYISPNMLPLVDQYFPSPYFLFKY